MTQNEHQVESADIAKVTKDHYERLFMRAKRQGQDRRWNGEIEYRHPISYREMIDDLLENPRNLKLSTLLQIRAAILHYMKGEGTEELREEMQSPEFQEKLAVAGGAGMPKSRKGGRHIPEKDFKLIVDRLEKKKKFQVQNDLLNCLRATVAAGARPVEWLNALWLDRPNGILRFRTAKAKARNALNGKSAIPGVTYKEGSDKPNYRIVNINKEDIEVVDAHILTVRKIINNSEWGFTWENMPQDLRVQCTKTFFENLRLALYRASKEVTGKSYSLYDARSTFAANRRARDGVKSASSELGHCSAEPKIASYYANSYKAWSQYKRSRKQSDAQTNQDLPDENQTMENDIPVTFNIPDFLTR